jgi:LysR family transcriptional regulator, low CO2-responsive transcriptional regulator
MPITFRRLQVFVAAAHDGNFRKTADRLGISQPSVSAQIRAIESHLGYPLFSRRRGASSTLSHEGRDFLTRARELVKVQRDLAAERQTVRREQAAVLRVSVGPILLETRVKPRLPEFHERCRHVAMEFVPFNPSSDGERAIRSGAVDVLLYTGGPPEGLQQRTEIIADVTCSIYGAPDLVAKLSSRSAELSAAPFVILPKDYRITQWFESQLALVGIRPRNIVARPPYMDVALRMAVEGKGLAVLFDEHAQESRKLGRLEPIGTRALSAFRVMMLGRRALRAQMAPALQFLREL